ncbi:hypothetical protein BH11PAT4_BH11PAT4_4020 [soil metagenome]
MINPFIPTLPVVDVEFDNVAATTQVDGLATRPGYAQAINALRSLVARATSACATLKARREDAYNTLIKREEEREAMVTSTETSVTTWEGLEVTAVAALEITQQSYETECASAGVGSHLMGENNLELTIAEKMNARHRFGVDVAEFCKAQGVPPALDEKAELQKSFIPSKPKQVFDWALRIVTGVLLGLGLLTLLGLVKERTITLQPEWLLIAAAIGVTITATAKVFVQKEATAFLRRKYLGKAADGLAVFTSWFAVAVVAIVPTVEATGINAMFQQKAQVAAAVSGGRSFAPPTWVLWAMAIISTGLLFGLAISMAREAWEQEELFLEAQKKVRDDHAKLVENWSKLAAAIEAWAPSEPGIVAARKLAVTARHEQMELNRIQQILVNERKKLADLKVGSATLTPSEEADLVACHREASAAVASFHEATNNFGKVVTV